jgi:hypothetical protein
MRTSQARSHRFITTDDDSDGITTTAGGRQREPAARAAARTVTASPLPRRATPALARIASNADDSMDDTHRRPEAMAPGGC